MTNDDVFIVGKDFMKIKITTSDVLPYNEQINISVCVVVVSSSFEENGVYYPQIGLHDVNNKNRQYFIK